MLPGDWQCGLPVKGIGAGHSGVRKADRFNIQQNGRNREPSNHADHFRRKAFQTAAAEVRQVEVTLIMHFQLAVAVYVKCRGQLYSNKKMQTALMLDRMS